MSSGLNQRAEELINKNLSIRKGALAEGQEVSDVREDIEHDFQVEKPPEKFLLAQQMEKEAGSKTDKCPATNSAFNAIKDYQSKIVDGKGGGTTRPGKGGE